MSETQNCDRETTARILQARTVHGRPYHEPIPRGGSFGAVLEKQSQTRGEQTFLIYRDGDAREEYSYSQFYARCCQVANWMQMALELSSGDRIATFAYNHPDTVAINFAAWMLGVCVVPISATEADDRVPFIQKNAECKAIFVMPDLIERYEKLKAKETCVRHFVQINGEPNAEYSQMREATAQSAELENSHRADLDTEALIVYTSGTTGLPKGVVLQHHQLLADAHSIAEWYGFTPRDRMQIVLPIHHVNGLIVTLVTPVYFGGSAVLCRKFSASRYWKVAAEEGSTCGSVVPTILAFLCEQKDDARAPEKFGFVICGAGPLTVEMGARFEERFSIPIMHGYGLSETTAYSCLLPFGLPPEEHQKWMRDFGYPSIGAPIDCNEVAIHDEHGVALAAGEKGEIVARGQNVMKYYFKRPDANAETFRHGWFRSGDEGFFQEDEQGRHYFFISGRLKELIIRGAVNYSPLEIDEVINGVDGIKAGMAVGFENNFYGEEIGAYVVREAGGDISEAQVIAACAQKLPFQSRPKVVIFGDEFPVTSTGKYQRNKLKPLFDEYRDAHFSKTSR